ncbi:MAG: hypothetical protein PHW96_01025 [Candidatus Nanoarchaeia archaeon]|nr:hypothetical protein [Candidatus Nanoarchaeia archaeon]
MKKGAAVLLLGLVGGVGLTILLLVVLFSPRCQVSFWIANVYHDENKSQVGAFFDGKCMNIPTGELKVDILLNSTQENVYSEIINFQGIQGDAVFKMVFNNTVLEYGKYYRLITEFPRGIRVSHSFYGGYMPSID